MEYCKLFSQCDDGDLNEVSFMYIYFIRMLAPSEHYQLTDYTHEFIVKQQTRSHWIISGTAATTKTT